jgi:hypothetical protein
MGEEPEAEAEVGAARRPALAGDGEYGDWGSSGSEKGLDSEVVGVEE